MSGIYYDPAERRLRLVAGTPEPAWPLVTHNLAAPAHRCRRILRSWLDVEELEALEWPEEILSRPASPPALQCQRGDPGDLRPAGPARRIPHTRRCAVR